MKKCRRSFTSHESDLKGESFEGEMEAPRYCFAFNFLRANSTGAAGGCRVRPAGTAPERGRDAQPPPAPSGLLHPPAGSAVLPWGPPNAPPRRRQPPRAREPAAGARRAPAVRRPRRRQRGGARGPPARPAVGSARPRADSPRLTWEPKNPRRRSSPTASREPDIRKKIVAPVEAGELGFVFRPASLRE